MAWTRRNGANDPFVQSGRALQEVFTDLPALRSRINVSGLRSEHIAAPGHHGYQRASVLKYRTGLGNRPWKDHLRHPGAQAPGRPPFRSSSRRRRQGNETSLISLDRCNRAVRRSLSPRCSGARNRALQQEGT
jgi:hypothetical protein